MRAAQHNCHRQGLGLPGPQFELTYVKRVFVHWEAGEGMKDGEFSKAPGGYHCPGEGLGGSRH